MGAGCGLRAAEFDEMAEAGGCTRRVVMAVSVHSCRRGRPLLREAVEQLTVDPDDDFGAVLQPGPGLVDRIGEFAGAL